MTETLAYLQPRHKLLLMTKGNITEQASKLERSGLKEYFVAAEIVELRQPLGELARAGVAPPRRPRGLSLSHDQTQQRALATPSEATSGGEPAMRATQSPHSAASAG